MPLKAQDMIPNDQLERLRRLLSHRRVISANDLQYELGISRATLTRYIRHLRDTFGVPVVIDRELGGYRLESSGHDFGPQFELPGLWFTAEEIHALLTMQHLLANLDTSGLLGPSVDQPVAMGYVATAHATPGTRVHAIVRGKPVPMEVRPMPFVPARYYRG